MIVNHYFHGGYYPVGGASSIAKAIRPIIERNGGAILLGHSVHSLIIENGAAIGIRASYESGPAIKEVSFYAPIVLSDMGAVETYQNLLKKHPPTAKFSKRSGIGKKLSAITLYIGFKESPEKLGIHGENFWIYHSYDHDLMLENSEDFLQGNPHYCYISFPSLKTSNPRSHSAEIIALIDYDLFLEFKKKPWLCRDASYYELKEKITEGLIKLADRNIPGFKELVIYAELSTPLSMENFTSRLEGSMYGIPATPERYHLQWLKIRTPIKNLFLTGSDIGSVGIVGALMGGVISAIFLNGPLGIFRIMLALKKHSKLSMGDTEALPSSRIHSLSNETPARLISKEMLSHHFYEIIFETSMTLEYIPGQHVYLELAPGEWRPYSIVQSQANKFTLIIDINPGGVGSHFTRDSTLGTLINMRLPTGKLKIHNSNNKKLVFIATGSGITPFIAMLQKLAFSAENKSKVILLWGIRDLNDEFSSRYLAEILKQMDLLIIPCVSRATAAQACYHGTVTTKIRELDLDFQNTDFYLCGNPIMIAEMHSWLRHQKATSVYFEV